MQRGRTVHIRLAHNQEIAGSTPASATIRRCIVVALVYCGLAPIYYVRLHAGSVNDILIGNDVNSFLPKAYISILSVLTDMSIK